MNIRENPPATKESLRRRLFQELRKEDFHGFIEVEMSEQDCKSDYILHGKPRASRLLDSGRRQGSYGRVRTSARACDRHSPAPPRLVASPWLCV
jgi:hypothetical protein